ncbi:hypothetical protein NQ314_000709 [Rhamnusium bicolor]|uniref:Uncharacterized protein n=1 Tax=Rhamnusium bicolor TaxID=1586634 RepID=A0AAV8ZVG0_9CUCU|nr:hypothetical protein NQ314_000709 [Rhamnusium bicolor]
MARKLKSSLPLLPSKLSKIVDPSTSVMTEESRKDKQRHNYNKRHSTKNLSDLSVGNNVWVTDVRAYG